MIIIVALLLWLLGIIIIVKDYKTESTRWCAAVAFVTGIGTFSTFWHENILNFLIQSYQISDSTINIMWHIDAIMTNTAHNVGPYLILMYGLSFANIVPKRLKKLIYSLLFIPSALSFILLPIESNYLKSPYEVMMHFRHLSIWVAPYMFGSVVFLIYSYAREKSPAIKRYKLLTIIVAVPLITYAVLSNVISRALGIDNAWRFFIILMPIQFLGFLYFAANYGVMGVKLKFERLRLDSTIKAITSGTRILNHTIKNQVNIISLCCNNAKISANKENIDLNDINTNLEIIASAANHLHEMVKRIRDQIEDIIIDEKENNVETIINNVITDIKPIADKKGIKISWLYCGNVNIRCDKVHFIEVLNNILKNAIEAISSNEGEIKIDCFRDKKEFFISVTDNGHGISKEDILHIFEPFFTTKKHTLNFGLGLSYCYNVITKHGGTLHIQSEKGIGTKVLIGLPNKKVTILSSDVRGERMVQWTK